MLDTPAEELRVVPVETEAADRWADVTDCTIELMDRRSDITDRTPHIQKERLGQNLTFLQRKWSGAQRQRQNL